MGDTLITVVTVFLIAILMLVFPLMSVAEKNDNITNVSIQALTEEFVDDVATKGVLTQEDYERYLDNLGATRKYIWCRDRNTSFRW